MSQKFDFETQELVAVVKEGPEKGQHVHVSADDLVRELREWADRKRSVTSSTEIVHVETLPQDYQDELAALNRKFSDMQSAIAELQERPQVTQPANDEVAVPAAFGELVKRVMDLEAKAVGRSDLDELAEVIGDIGKAALMHAGTLQKRADALEARVSNLPSELLMEVGRAQFDLKNNRRA